MYMPVCFTSCTTTTLCKVQGDVHIYLLVCVGTGCPFEVLFFCMILFSRLYRFCLSGYNVCLSACLSIYKFRVRLLIMANSNYLQISLSLVPLGLGQFLIISLASWKFQRLLQFPCFCCCHGCCHSYLRNLAINIQKEKNEGLKQSLKHMP